jgi:hypothetical protein
LAIVRATSLLVAVPAAVLLVAGCGEDTTAGSGSLGPSSSVTASGSTGPGVAALSADEILKKATTALQAAKSVRIKGEGGSGAQRFAIDLRYAGDTSTGTLGINGQTIELRKLGRTVYLKLPGN